MESGPLRGIGMLRRWIVLDAIPANGSVSASVRLRHFGLVRGVLSAHGHVPVRTVHDGTIGSCDAYEVEGISLSLRIDDPSYRLVDGWRVRR